MKTACPECKTEVRMLRDGRLAVHKLKTSRSIYKVACPFSHATAADIADSSTPLARWMRAGGYVRVAGRWVRAYV